MFSIHELHDKDFSPWYHEMNAEEDVYIFLTIIFYLLLFYYHHHRRHHYYHHYCYKYYCCLGFVVPKAISVITLVLILNFTICLALILYEVRYI